MDGFSFTFEFPEWMIGHEDVAEKLIQRGQNQAGMMAAKWLCDERTHLRFDGGAIRQELEYGKRAEKTEKAKVSGKNGTFPGRDHYKTGFTREQVMATKEPYAVTAKKTGKLKFGVSLKGLPLQYWRYARRKRINLLEEIIRLSPKETKMCADIISVVMTMFLFHSDESRRAERKTIKAA